MVKTLLTYFFPLFLIWHKLRSLFKKEVLIVLVHDVHPKQYSQFNRLVSFLKKNYQFITPLQFEDYLEGKFELERSAILFSFDDGFKSSKEAANVCLDPHGIKAIFFVCSKFVGLVGKEARAFIAAKIMDGEITEDQVTNEQLPMSREDVLDLSKDGHLIGSHTSNHRRLSEVTNQDEFDIELVESKKELSEITGKRVEHFAYPFGDVGSISATALEQVMNNYKYCYSGIRGQNTPETQKAQIRREVINLGHDFSFNRLICVGGFSPFYALNRKTIDRYY